MRCRYNKFYKKEFLWLDVARDGKWSLGCIPCAWALRHEGTGESWRMRTFARYDFHGYRRLSFAQTRANLSQHCTGEAHKEAARRCPYFHPLPAAARARPAVCGAPVEGAKCAIQADAVASPECTADPDDATAKADRKLLKGKVPQLDDWLDTWNAVLEKKSIRQQRREQKRGGRPIRSRQAIRKERRIMHMCPGLASGAARLCTLPPECPSGSTGPG